MKKFEMFLTVLILAFIVIIAAFLLLGLNIFFRKRNFPETSVGHNHHMKNIGITCVKCDEVKQYRKLKGKFNINPKELKILAE